MAHELNITWYIYIFHLNINLMNLLWNDSEMILKELTILNYFKLFIR